ncbi:ribbon-helix-helix protein, CopG family [Bdellovibrionota bacterium FG-2]
MSLLEFKKKKRNTPVTVRLTEDTVTKLKAIAEKHDVSQADVIERLIEAGYSEMKTPPKVEKKRPR